MVINKYNQSHKCTKTCRKKGPDCRFGFPRMPSNKTLVSLPVNKSDEEEQEKFKSGKAKLEKMRAYLENEECSNDKSLEEILKDLEIPPKAYENALKVSERGKQIVLKRKPNECYINNYNYFIFIIT